MSSPLMNDVDWLDPQRAYQYAALVIYLDEGHPEFGWDGIGRPFCDYCQTPIHQDEILATHDTEDSELGDDRLVYYFHERECMRYWLAHKVGPLYVIREEPSL